MIKVFEPDAPVKKELFLKLIDGGPGDDPGVDSVTLVLVDRWGKMPTAGNILTIDKYGLQLHGGITKDAPFDLTDSGKIVIG